LKDFVLAEFLLRGDVNSMKKELIAAHLTLTGSDRTSHRVTVFPTTAQQRDGNFTKVVQRIPIKIGSDDIAFAVKLRPGLSVIATVRTKR